MILSDLSIKHPIFAAVMILAPVNQKWTTGVLGEGNLPASVP